MNKSKLLLIGYLIFLFFAFDKVNGASVHVCEWTNDNNFCVESNDENFKAFGGCKEGYKDPFTTLDKVPNSNCKIGTCVPSGKGICLSDTFKIKCQHDNVGRWFDLPLGQVQDCQKALGTRNTSKHPKPDES